MLLSSTGRPPRRWRLEALNTAGEPGNNGDPGMHFANQPPQSPDGCQPTAGAATLVQTKASVYAESEKEAQEFKWIESEKAGRDLGEDALRNWVQTHWWGYLRARWVEHLQ